MPRKKNAAKSKRKPRGSMVKAGEANVPSVAGESNVPSVRGSRGARRQRGRRRYTDDQRTRILATARREGLTANEVQRRFGVTPVTYYSWRKKSGATRQRRPGRTRQPGVLESGVNLVEAIRGELRNQIQRVLPELVRTEVGAALLGTDQRGRRRRGKR